MHELAMAEAILDVVLRHAEGRRVTALQVQIGHLRQVVPSALAFSFEVVTQGTVAEGALLEIEAVQAVGRCRGCGAETVLESFPFQCGACEGFALNVVAGEELMVVSLEMEEVESGISCG